MDQLFLVGVNASLHDVHARTKNSLERSHIQYYTDRHKNIQTDRHTDTNTETQRTDRKMYRHRQPYRHTDRGKGT